jgi:hypothetical protein
MKRMIALVLALGLIIGCQKKTETQQAAQPPQQAQNSTAAANQATNQQSTPARQKPVMRPSDARITVESPTVAKGQKGSFKIDYYAVEPAKAIVIPLKVPDGMILDSVSFAGSVLAYLANRPVRLNNEAHTLLIAAIPVTEPKIPAKDGLAATVFFTMKSDAASGAIENTFVPPGNYLMYVDTLSSGVEPNYEGGQVTVK